MLFSVAADIFGISDHDLMFSHELDHEEEFEDGVMPTMDPRNQEYIQHRVGKEKVTFFVATSLSFGNNNFF